MDLLDPEPRDGFRRNLLIVLAIHAAMLGAIWLFNRIPRETPKEQITWLDGSALGGSPAEEPPLPTLSEVPPPASPPEPEPTPLPEPTPAEPELIVAPPPAPEPTPVPEPKTTPAPTPKPKPTPKSTPPPAAKKNPTPQPKKIAKSTPKPKPKTSATPQPKRETAKTTPAPASGAKPATTSATSGNAGDSTPRGAPNGSATGSATSAQAMTYFAAVGEEFRGCWKVYKPLVAEGIGDRLTALVHVRINSSGSVIEATLTRSTGNREVDQSINKALSDFKRVPAPPSALLQSGVFESDMAVILSI